MNYYEKCPNYYLLYILIYKKWHRFSSSSLETLWYVGTLSITIIVVIFSKVDYK